MMQNDFTCRIYFIQTFPDRGAFFVWSAPIVSWPRIMCSQVRMLIFLEYECLKEERLFLTSLEQICNDTWLSSLSAPKLETRKSFPYSPRAPIPNGRMALIMQPCLLKSRFQLSPTSVNLVWDHCPVRLFVQVGIRHSQIHKQFKVRGWCQSKDCVPYKFAKSNIGKSAILHLNVWTRVEHTRVTFAVETKSSNEKQVK